MLVVFPIIVVILCFLLFIGIRGLVQKKYHGVYKWFVVVGMISSALMLWAFLWGTYLFSWP